MSEQPSPEQLVERLKNFGGTEDECNRNMAEIIAAAEAGGSAHMEAVADYICSLPAAPPDPKAPVYNTRTGRPAFHGTNVLLELRAKVAGRTFVAREAIDPYVFDLQFGADKERFETFIRYFIGRSFGQVAVSDDQSYRYFRSLVWIVRPQDEHDLKRCAEGRKADPYCDTGLITKAPRLSIPIPEAMHVIEPRPLRSDVPGVCPCRCHESDGSAARARSLDAMYVLGTFDEAQLDGNA